MISANLEYVVAYRIAYRFLEIQNSVAPSVELQALLSAMSVLQDGLPADPSIAQGWNQAVEDAINGKVDLSLQLG